MPDAFTNFISCQMAAESFARPSPAAQYVVDALDVDADVKSK